MEEYAHTVLCVDDDNNILNSLKRLLRKEEYRLLIANSGPAGLELLRTTDVDLVITDQRMAPMSGIEFLQEVKKELPDVMRIILTGYTDVDSITESINKGHIYKFFLKPWNDHNLKFEIRQALEQHDLIKSNRELHEQILDQNEELKTMNDNLERMVQERTEVLELQNQALALSRAILEDIPIPVIGVSSEHVIVMYNHQAKPLRPHGRNIELGAEVITTFSEKVDELVAKALDEEKKQIVADYVLTGSHYRIDIVPLSGTFKGKGVVLTLEPLEEC
jgi:response regulator RpfG family c-di-GMP phosphodiesterase